MATAQYFDNYSSTLASGYTAGGTSLVVTSATLLPAVGNFELTVDRGLASEEQFLCTARSGTTLTVVGAQGNTSASNHSAGATVDGAILGTTTMNQIRKDINRSMSAASLDALAATEYRQGDVVRITSGHYQSFYNGTAWEYSDAISFVRPPTTSWSWVGQASCTLDTTSGGIIIENPTVETGIHTHARIRTAPATPYHVIGAFTCQLNGGTNVMAGLCFREASTGKMTIFGSFQTGHTQFVAFYLSDENTYGGSTIINDSSNLLLGPYRWLRLGDDGTNKTFDISHNGINWVNLLTVARTSIFTPDQIGVFVNSGISSIQLLSWEITA